MELLVGSVGGVLKESPTRLKGELGIRGSVRRVVVKDEFAPWKDETVKRREGGGK